MLTDAQNRDYKLVSSAQKLDSYVGQEVQITVTLMDPNDPSSGEKSVRGEMPQSGTPA